MKSVEQSTVDALVEEVHLLRRVLHDIAKDVFYHRLSEVHGIFQISERYFRLDHPELCRVSLSVGVLSSEGWPECVYVSERKSKNLCLQLSAYREVRRLSEEVL